MCLQFSKKQNLSFPPFKVFEINHSVQLKFNNCFSDLIYISQWVEFDTEEEQLAHADSKKLQTKTDLKKTKNNHISDHGCRVQGEMAIKI